jgi:hypothetical protein
MYTLARMNTKHGEALSFKRHSQKVLNAMTIFSYQEADGEKKNDANLQQT